jgi:hypothetical protein
MFKFKLDLNKLSNQGRKDQLKNWGLRKSTTLICNFHFCIKQNFFFLKLQVKMLDVVHRIKRCFDLEERKQIILYS